MKRMTIAGAYFQKKWNNTVDSNFETQASEYLKK